MLKNRPGRIVQIPPTLPTLLLPSPLPSVTIRPDLQRTAIRALHPLLPPDLPQGFQAIFPTWEKNLPDGFTVHTSPSPSDLLSPHYPPNLRSLEGMSLRFLCPSIPTPSPLFSPPPAWNRRPPPPPSPSPSYTPSPERQEGLNEGPLFIGQLLKPHRPSPPRQVVRRQSILQSDTRVLR